MPFVYMPFKEYPKIKYLGTKDTQGIFDAPGNVVIQAKVDGANFSFWIDNGILHFGKHHNDLTDSEILAVSKKTGLKSWKGVEPVINAWAENSKRFVKDYIYYGESMNGHRVPYGNQIPGFIGYDVFDTTIGQFLDWPNAQVAFKLLGLPFIYIHDIISLINDININNLKKLFETSFYYDGPDEGIVIKRYDQLNKYGRPLFAKLVNDEFKENKRPPKQERAKITDEIKIANYYATPARIEKAIYSLRDEGAEIDMPMMATLFKDVVMNILEENILDIYEDHKLINFKTLEGLVSKKCLKVLKDVIRKQI